VYVFVVQLPKHFASEDENDFMFLMDTTGHAFSFLFCFGKSLDNKTVIEI